MENELLQRIAVLEQEVGRLKSIVYQYNDISSKVETKSVQFRNSVGFYGVQPVDQAAAIASPSGGGTVDANARTAIDLIRVALTNLGLTK